MAIARMVELIGGLGTGLLGIIVGIVTFKDDFEISQRLEHEFHPVRDFLILLLFFTIPNLVVATGAYFHAVRRDSGIGRLLIFFGGAFVVGLFLLFELNAGYGAMYMIGLRFWPVVLTLLTAGISLAVREEPHRHKDA